MTVTTTVEGRQRYPVNIRYPRELRDTLEKLQRVLMPVMRENAPSAAGMVSSSTATFVQVPLGELAEIKIVNGPTVIKSEEGLLTAYVYVDFFGRDVGGYVNEAKKSVASLKIPDGYRLAVER